MKTKPLMLPPKGFNFFLFSRLVQADKFSKVRQYAIVAYNAETRRKVATLPLVDRDGNLVFYRDESGGLVALDTRGGEFPTDPKRGLRLYEPNMR